MATLLCKICLFAFLFGGRRSGMQLLRCGAVCLKAGFRPERRGGTGAEGLPGAEGPRASRLGGSRARGAKKEASKQWGKKEASKQWGKKGGKQARGLKGGNCEEAMGPKRRQLRGGNGA